MKNNHKNNLKIISIIISVYNTELYLGRCLESILSQSQYNINFEVIVINDNSPGNCEEIIINYQKIHPIIYLKNETNKGLYQSRQIGVNASSGDYLAFVDSDDWIESDMYYKMLCIAESEDLDIVECGFYFEQNTKTIPNPLPILFLSGESIFKSLYRFPGYNIIYRHEIWNKIFKRQLWNISLPWFPFMKTSEDGGEDLIRISIIFFFAHRYSNIGEPLYHYNRINSESNSQSTSPEKVRRYIMGLSSCLYSLEILLKNNFSDLNVNQLVENKLWRDIYSLFLRISQISNQKEKISLMHLFIDRFENYFFLIFSDKIIRAGKVNNIEALHIFVNTFYSGLQNEDTRKNIRNFSKWHNIFENELSTDIKNIFRIINERILLLENENNLLRSKEYILGKKIIKIINSIAPQNSKRRKLLNIVLKHKIIIPILL